MSRLRKALAIAVHNNKTENRFSAMLARLKDSAFALCQKAVVAPLYNCGLSFFEALAENRPPKTFTADSRWSTGFSELGFTVSSSSGDGKLPLLHVDDSADDRFLVKRAIALTKTPFTYHEADALESAMPFFQFQGHRSELEQRPALVLLDYELGGPNGVDFLSWLRIQKKITSLPVVMFSGSPGTGHIAECYAAGVDHYLTKPNDFERLKRIVSTLHKSVAGNIPGPIRLLNEYRADPRSDGASV